ncbi:hypothetical protein PoB_006521300 [Plakobranchus ocellatus]|uniref:Uncharacterized protein n=1 Tax=Plakobranchus ocellatus TaxID=259542 RepID=A0AAV4D3U8_9GAST|nr:hypothetical protein PoB_006521300 [Plakobranchus ocellatus]
MMVEKGVGVGTGRRERDGAAQDAGGQKSGVGVEVNLFPVVSRGTSDQVFASWWMDVQVFVLSLQWIIGPTHSQDHLALPCL